MEVIEPKCCCCIPVRVVLILFSIFSIFGFLIQGFFHMLYGFFLVIDLFFILFYIFVIIGAILKNVKFMKVMYIMATILLILALVSVVLFVVVGVLLAKNYNPHIEKPDKKGVTTTHSPSTRDGNILIFGTFYVLFYSLNVFCCIIHYFLVRKVYNYFVAIEEAEIHNGQPLMTMNKA